MNTVKFKVAPKGEWPSRTPGTFTLVTDMWDDFRFKTLFQLWYASSADLIEIGNVKVARLGMKEREPHIALPASFRRLDPDYYSLGQDREYYENLAKLPNGVASTALSALRDVAADSALFEQVHKEDAFSISLTRTVSDLSITTQFRRIIAGQAPLTRYKFGFEGADLGETTPPLRIDFEVVPGVMPPTNVHVLIGANGVGKSHLLRKFVEATQGSTASGAFIDELKPRGTRVDEVPFANVVHVAFSAFDRPQDETVHDSTRPKVLPVGLTKDGKSSLDKQFLDALDGCLRGPRRIRWSDAIRTLSASDALLADEPLETLLDLPDDERGRQARDMFSAMSSGHKIVVLTMTRLVELMEERSLILIDEPETHLHPPLLSALARAISDLAIDRNSVAIIATHSPVVLQEVPKSCVWVLRRSGEDLRASQLETETFGESVSRLTSEVFHLDVTRTGYHEVLGDLLERNGNSSAAALTELGGQLGAEGRFLLEALAQGARSEGA